MGWIQSDFDPLSTSSTPPVRANRSPGQDHRTCLPAIEESVVRIRYLSSHVIIHCLCTITAIRLSLKRSVQIRLPVPWSSPVPQTTMHRIYPYRLHCVMFPGFVHECHAPEVTSENENVNRMIRRQHITSWHVAYLLAGLPMWRMPPVHKTYSSDCQYPGVW